jgi:hypothetical protein
MVVYIIETYSPPEVWAGTPRSSAILLFLKKQGLFSSKGRCENVEGVKVREL